MHNFALAAISAFAASALAQQIIVENDCGESVFVTLANFSSTGSSLEVPAGDAVRLVGNPITLSKSCG